MLTSIIWFIGLLGLASCSFALGWWIGKQPKWAAQTAILVLVGLIALAALPRFRPALAAEFISLSLLVRFEGLFGVFPWMVLVGVLSSSKLSSQLRRTTPLLLIMGVLYFLYGGIWMILPTIDIDEPEQRSQAGVTMQSRHDSCVPSACATAVRRFGISTSEAHMCEIVQAKPSRGSTLVRAAWGLRKFLEPHDVDVAVEDLSIDEVVARSKRNRPILITVKSSLVADHMIAVLGTYGEHALIANPSPFGREGRFKPVPIHLDEGLEVFDMETMRAMHRRGAIVLTPRREVSRE
jgi:hypothetical protein